MKSLSEKMLVCRALTVALAVGLLSPLVAVGDVLVDFGDLIVAYGRKRVVRRRPGL